MNDSCAWLPEPNSIFIGDRGQKIENLLVIFKSDCKVFFGTFFGQDQVITMHCGWYGNF